MRTNLLTASPGFEYLLHLHSALHDEVLLLGASKINSSNQEMKCKQEYLSLCGIILRCSMYSSFQKRIITKKDKDNVECSANISKVKWYKVVFLFCGQFVYSVI